MKRYFSKMGYIALIAVAAAALSTGCKEEDDSLDIKVTKDNLCSEIAKVTCRNMFTCCTGLEIESMLGVEQSTTETACRTDQRLECEALTAELQDSLDKNRASLTIASVESCLNELIVEDQCFPQVTTFATSCTAEAVKGNQAAGAECLNGFDCVEDAYCGTDRKCKALAGAGEDCGTTAECVPGLYCGMDESDTAATGTVCLSPNAVGDACDGDYECAEDAYCEVDPVSGDGTCAALTALGTACDSDDMCLSGFCLPGSCENGNACFDDGDCGLGSCRDSGMSCIGNGDCYGMCETSGSTCYDGFPCAGTCSISASGCYDDTECPGVCSNSAYSCYDDSYCDPLDASDSCVQTETCVAEACIQTDVCEGASTCEGRVCAEQYFTVDYCHANPLTLFI